MKILNLTQHQATPAQIEAGVIDLECAERLSIIELLTFDELPTVPELIHFMLSAGVNQLKSSKKKAKCI